MSLLRKKNKKDALPSVLIATGIFPPDIGGPATYVETLIEQWRKMGIMVEVSVFSQFRNHPRFVRHLLYIWDLLKKGRRFDILYAQDPISVGIPVFFASLILRKPYAIKVVGDWAWEKGVLRYGVESAYENYRKNKRRVPWRVRFLTWCEGVVVRHACCVIVPSRYLAGVVHGWGALKNKIFIIPNAVSVVDLPEREVLRRLIPPDGYFMVTAGRLVPWKGFDTLIEVMAEIVQEFPRAELLIIGGGPDEKRLQEKITALSLEKSVRLSGPVNKRILHTYIKMADLFILNSGYEGYSHQICEALCLGVPVAVSRVGGNLELIEHGKNGLLFDYDNKEEIKKVITRFLKDKTFARKLSYAKREGEKKNDVSELAAKTFKAIYEGVNA